VGLAQEVRSLYNQQVRGTGLRMTEYPANAAGTALKASGLTTGAYKYAAANANVKAIVAKATITENFKIVGLVCDTPSAASIFIVKIGNGAAAAGALSAQLIEVRFEIATDAGGYPGLQFPFVGTVVPDAATDGILGDAASSNAAADDTINASVSVLTGLGT